jgi:hypothetical protein
MVNNNLIALLIIGLCLLICIQVLGTAGASPDIQDYNVSASHPPSVNPTDPAGSGTITTPHKDTTPTEAEKKLSSDLVKLITTGSQGTQATGTLPGDDRVYVYIHVIPAASTHIIDSYVINVTDRDEQNHIAVAWVSISRLEALASLPEVLQIQEVIPPRQRLPATGTVQNTYTGTPTTQGTEMTTSAGSKQSTPTQAPGPGLPAICGMLAILVVIKKLD